MESILDIICKAKEYQNVADVTKFKLEGEQEAEGQRLTLKQIRSSVNVYADLRKKIFNLQCTETKSTIPK